MESEAFKPFQQTTDRQSSNQPYHMSQGKSLTFPEESVRKQYFQTGQQEFPEETHSRMLREVAQMTVQSFHSSQEAMSVALEVIGRFLDCQTLFIGRVRESEVGKTDGRDVNQHTLKIMEVLNKDTTLPVAGAEGALNRTYCQTVWQTREPLVVEDSGCQPFYQRLANTREYNIGSYIGVPLIYSDGRVYGTLCAQDPHPHLLSNQPESLELMQIVARLLISIIEREELMQQLEDLNRRFNEFLSIASHELKGPLTTIQGNIQFAQRTLHTLQAYPLQEQEAASSELEKLQRYLERAARQVHVQDRLASDLIDVSRIRVGKLELRLRSCDIGQIVRDAVEDQRQTTADRVINLDLPAEQLLTSGDADRLGQVVRNYLTNALRYSASTKPVGVSVTTDGIIVQVSVSDLGAGLTLDEQQRVWERFYRAKDVRVLSGSSIGLGLGLHICKIIIELHGGSVGLSSRPGTGSRFWFTLPLGGDL